MMHIFSSRCAVFHITFYRGRGHVDWHRDVLRDRLISGLIWIHCYRLLLRRFVLAILPHGSGCTGYAVTSVSRWGVCIRWVVRVLSSDKIGFQESTRNGRVFVIYRECSWLLDVHGTGRKIHIHDNYTSKGVSCMRIGEQLVGANSDHRTIDRANWWLWSAIRGVISFFR